MISALLTRLGADPRHVPLLIHALRKERIYRIESRLQDGVDLSVLKFLVVIPLLISGFSLLALAVNRSDQPGFILSLLFLAQTGAFLFMMVHAVINDLMSDADFRAVAATPVKGSSFLIARLWITFRNGLIMAAFVAGPTLLFGLFGLGTPILTSVTAALLILWWTAALTLTVSAVVAGLIRIMGLDNVRLAAPIVATLGFIGTILMLRDLDLTNMDPALLSSLAVPTWLPSSWPVSLAALTWGEQQTDLLILAALVLIPVPWLAFRWAAADYTTAIVRAGARRGGGRYTLTGRWLGVRSTNPAVRVVARLFIAHLRGDWRFRLKLVALPGFLLLLAVLGSTEFREYQLFGDPFTQRGLFHPAVLWMILFMTPPLLALPLISQSSHYQAAWIMRIGQVEEAAYRPAVRAVCRRAILMPMTLMFIIFYLWHGMPLPSLAAHMLILWLLGEVMTAQIQLLFAAYPFSRTDDDEEMSMRMLPMVFGIEFFGGLIAWGIYMFAYRWWWLYGLLVMLLVWMAKAGVAWGQELEQKLASETGADGGADRKKAETPPAQTPLMVALSKGHLHTAGALLAACDDPHMTDAQGRTLLDHARAGGNAKLIELVQNRLEQSS